MGHIGGHAVGGLTGTDRAVEKLSHPFRMIRIHAHGVGVHTVGSGSRHVGEDGVGRTGVGWVDLESLSSRRLAAIRLNLGDVNA